MKQSDSAANKQKLQLFLSHNGVCSRRKALNMIMDGHVTVNGTVLKEPSTIIDNSKDKICVKGSVIKILSEEYIILHKPSGVMTTKEDKYAEQTVYDLLPKKYQHLFPVGRLDKHTEGLLLLTNDGDVAFKLTHPKFHLAKEYLVIIAGALERKNQLAVTQGILLDGEKTVPAKIRNIKIWNNKTELLLEITEGKKRQIRRVFQSVGHKVLYLKRLSQGPIRLGNLGLGQHRTLLSKEIAQLKGLLK